MKAVIFGLEGYALTDSERDFFRDADPAGYILFKRNCDRADQLRALTDSLRELSGRDDPEAGLQATAALTPGVVAVTLGERGSLFVVAGVLHHLPAPAVVARDTNGAGDVFHGAYTLAVAEGRGALEAARFATAAAALKCRNGIGWSAIPDRAAVDRFVPTF